MRRSGGGLWLGALAVLVAAAPAAAQYQTGDVFGSVGNGLVYRYNNAGTFQQQLNTGQGGYTTGSAFDKNGNFYVTDFSASQVSKFDINGNLLGTFGSGYATPESILFDAAGNAYTGNLGNGLQKRNGTTGAVLQQYSTGRVDWFDLTSNADTAYFTTEGGRVNRFDLTTNTALSPFSVAGGDFALRLLKSGGLLVADESAVHRMDASGNIVQTYAVAGDNGFFALNLDPDGTSFWTGSFATNKLYKFDIASGNLLETIATNAPGGLFGVSVFGEITVVNPPPPTTAPEPVTMALLGTGLAGIAAARRRRKKAVRD